MRGNEDVGAREGGREEAKGLDASRGDRARRRSASSHARPALPRSALLPLLLSSFILPTVVTVVVIVPLLLNRSYQ